MGFVGVKLMQFFVSKCPPLTHCFVNKLPLIVFVRSLFLDLVLMLLTLEKTLSQSAFETGRHNTAKAKSESSWNSFKSFPYFLRYDLIIKKII